ncbi:ent-kaurene oxidase protein [Rutstroemia sp. NJR-2017a WRK4]|nr:ent-kaurene oxidase protein [Rutstroemia sp. NJR-2017a WRK4]
MENISVSSSAVLLVGFFLLRYVVEYVQQRWNSDAPVVENSWLDTLTWRGKSGKQLLEEAGRERGRWVVGEERRGEERRGEEKEGRGALREREKKYRADECYSKKGKAFRTMGPCGPQWTLPTVAFDQVSKMGASVLDPSEANEEMLALMPFIRPESEDVTHFVPKMTRSLNTVIPLLISETRQAFQQNFAPASTSPKDIDADGYTHVCLHPPIQTSLSMIVSRVICGEKYARDPTWIKTVAEFARGVFFHGIVLRKFPRRYWGWIAPWLSTMGRVKKIDRMLTADVTARVRGGAGEKSEDDGTILPALITEVQARGFYKDKSEAEMVQGVNFQVMRLLFAMVDTTAMTFNHVLYDILGHDKNVYAKRLREEIRETRKRHGGVWTREALGELRLLDSFLKESQRMHPLAYTLGSRKVVRGEGVRVRVGKGEEQEKEIHIKKGERIEMCVWAVHMDPENWDEPKVFKGFRHAESAVPSAMPSEKFMSFGFGRHACPGRYVALTMEKLMVVEFLMNYDWKEMERLKDWSFGWNNIPDMKSKVAIRRLREDEVKELWGEE